MSIFSSYKKIFLLGFIVVILIAIPFSVYIAQKKQNISSKADASTTLSFDPASPPPLTVKVGEILTLNIVLDPKTGAAGSRPNQVSFVKLSISFDPEKFTTVSDSLAPNPNSPNTLTSVLEDAAYTSGTASISLSIGADPTRVVTTKTKIAILQLKALSATDANNPSSITFDTTPNTTQVLSLAPSDQTSENVLLNLLSTNIPAKVTIVPATATITSAPVSPGTTPTLTPAPSPGSVPTPTPTSSPLVVLTPTPVVVAPLPTAIVLAPEVILPPTGPGENILGIGILGAIFTIIGGALFILL